MRPSRHADPRLHLLQAALRAFARRGYDGAGMRDVAHEADVAPSLLYHYFTGKEALLHAAFQHSTRLVLEAFLVASAVPEPRARLGALLQVSARLVRENVDFWRVSYGVRFQSSVLDTLTEGVAASHAAWLANFTTLFRDLGHPEPEVEARVLFGSLDGCFQHFVLDPEHYPLDAVVRRLTLDHGGTPPTETPA